MTYSIGYFHIELAEVRSAPGPASAHSFRRCYGIQFTYPSCYVDGLTATYMTHIFDMRCRKNGIQHKLTKIRHPWTSSQVERVNRTIKEPIVKRYHCDSHDQLAAHLHDYIDAHNYGRRLRTLRGLTPYEYICKSWKTEPERFIFNPHHQNLGSNI